MGSKKPFKLIIACSPEFDDYYALDRAVDYFLYNIAFPTFVMPEHIEIVTGIAHVADQLSERYAIANGMGIKRFPANWRMHGRSAGFKRNKQMAIYADALIAFPLGKCFYTRDMVKQARGLGLTVKYGEQCVDECHALSLREIEDDNQFMLEEMNRECERTGREVYADAKYDQSRHDLERETIYFDDVIKLMEESP